MALRGLKGTSQMMAKMLDVDRWEMCTTGKIFYCELTVGLNIYSNRRGVASLVKRLHRFLLSGEDLDHKT